MHHDTAALTMSWTCLQEAALIRELRRLQKFLHQEQERVRFPHAIEIRPTNSRSDYRGGTGSRTPPKAVNGSVERLLRKLGLNQAQTGNGAKPARQATDMCEPIATPRHEIAAASAARAKARTDGSSVVNHCKDAKWSRTSGSRLSFLRKKTWRVSLLDRIGSPSPAEVRNELRLVFVSVFEFLRSAPVFERLRSACKFLVGRGQVTVWRENRSQTHHAFKPCFGGRTQNRSSGADLRRWHPRDLGDFDAAFERGCRARHASRGIGCEENTTPGWWRGGEYSRA